MEHPAANRPVLGEPVSESELKRLRLPEAPPATARLRYSDEKEGWPPHPVDAQLTGTVESTPIPGLISDEQESEFRKAAEGDERVRSGLGQHHAYIGIQQPWPKGESLPVPPKTELTFFSHTHNVAVLVRMEGARVVEVSRDEEGEPPAGFEEILASIEIARAEPALKGKLDGLFGDAIVLSGAHGDPGYGHRLMWVTFSENEFTDATRYAVFVDMIDRRVIGWRDESKVGDDATNDGEE